MFFRIFYKKKTQLDPKPQPNKTKLHFKIPPVTKCKYPKKIFHSRNISHPKYSYDIKTIVNHSHYRGTVFLPKKVKMRIFGIKNFNLYDLLIKKIFQFMTSDGFFFFIFKLNFVNVFKINFQPR